MDFSRERYLQFWLPRRTAGAKSLPLGQAFWLVQGKVLDSAGNPLSDANVLPYLNGKPFVPAVNGSAGHKELASGRNGLFMIKIPAPLEKIKDGKWSLKITRPSFKPSPMIPTEQRSSTRGLDESACNDSLRRPR